MNEELQSALVGILNKVSSGADFALEQAPDVVQQLLSYAMVESLLFFFLGIVLIGLSIISWRARPSLDSEGQKTRTEKWPYTSSKEDLSSGVHYCKAMGFIPVILFVVGLCTISDSLAWLKIWIAPKVYILEYAASLVT